MHEEWCFAGFFLLDFFVFDPDTTPGSWTELTYAVEGSPGTRFGMGMTSAGGKLYMFGGHGGERHGDAVAERMLGCLAGLPSTMDNGRGQRLEPEDACSSQPVRGSQHPGSLSRLCGRCTTVCS